MTTEPLFKNSYDALVFAFNYSGQQYGKSPMIKITGTHMPSGKGLSGVDGAAQAGFIRAEVAAMGRILEAILIARFAPHTVPCSCRQPCCIGEKPNKEWTEAVAVLADHLRDNVLKSCVTTWDMRVQYIMRQFTKKGDRVSLEEIARRNNVSERTVSTHFGIVRAFFNGKKDNSGHVPGIEEVAQIAIEGRLSKIEMIKIDCTV